MWLIKGAGFLNLANGVLRGPRIGTTFDNFSNVSELGRNEVAIEPANATSFNQFYHANRSVVPARKCLKSRPRTISCKMGVSGCP